MRVLDGKRILLAEDEALIALMVEEMLVELGADIVARVGTIADALAVAATVTCDAAVLDINLRGAAVFPAAALLDRRGIPIVFATGYGRGALGAGYTGPVIEKPYTCHKLARALATALAEPVMS